MMGGRNQPAPASWIKNHLERQRREEMRSPIKRGRARRGAKRSRRENKGKQQIKSLGQLASPKRGKGIENFVKRENITPRRRGGERERSKNAKKTLRGS